MNAVSLEMMREADELIDVRSEQIRILYAAVPGSLVTILVCSLLLSAMMWSLIDHATILAWFALTNLLSGLRLYLYYRFRQQANRRIVSDYWYRSAVVTSVASGITWGAAGYIFYAEQSLVHQVFLVFVIAGMCAGAITTLSAILEAAGGFVVVTVAPLIVKFNLANVEFSPAMTLMAIIFVVMILVSARRINQTIVESLEVRHQREKAEQTIRHQAHFDELTNLPNRRLLLTTLRQEIARADRHRRTGAVFFIDLDRFKSVNDSLGHAVGDELLVNVATRIGGRLRKEDSVSRLGGDEFVVLLPEVGDDYETVGRRATNIADQIRGLFDEPFLIQGHDIHLTISIGIALFPLDAAAEDLIKYADVAMYRAKNEGRDGVRLFSAEMQEAVNQQRIVEKGLREALENDRFQLYFQAQYGHRGDIVGAEVLLRWNHPQQGLVAPGNFIDIAEQTGLIVPIGDWVLRSACEHLVKLGADLVLAVNLSPKQFADPKFVDRFKQILQETRADARRLRFEITENLAMVDIDHTIATMKELKGLGISFSVDDFGTGYSSLGYLNRLPVDELKIDQSFVRNISGDSDHAAIVDAIIAMARQLNLEIVAEGIESAAEFAYLEARDCDRFQGYYFSRPEPFDRLVASLDGAAEIESAEPATSAPGG